MAYSHSFSVITGEKSGKTTITATLNEKTTFQKIEIGTDKTYLPDDLILELILPTTKMHVNSEMPFSVYLKTFDGVLVRAPNDIQIILESEELLASPNSEILTIKQNTAYARRYREFMAHVRMVEGQRTPGQEALSDGVARAYHKLLAYKDEYEVARLYTDGRFRKQIAETFEGNFSLHFSLAPPLLAARDAETGHLKKRLYGPWIMAAYRILANLKFLRGTALDVFGYSAERRSERRQIEAYEATVRELLGNLTRDNHALAVEVARLPLKMRGYGHIKQANVEAATAREAELMEFWRNPSSQASAAE